MSSRINWLFSILLLGALVFNAALAQAQIQTQLDEQVARAIQALEAQNSSNDTNATEKMRNKKQILENLKSLIFDKVVPGLKGKLAEQSAVAEFENYLLMIPTDAKEKLVCADVKVQFDRDEAVLKNIEHKELLLAKKILNLFCP